MRENMKREVLKNPNLLSVAKGYTSLVYPHVLSKSDSQEVRLSVNNESPMLLETTLRRDKNQIKSNKVQIKLYIPKF